MIDTGKMTRPDILRDIRDLLKNDCAAAELLPRDYSAEKFLAAVSTMEEMRMLEDRAFHNFVQLYLSSRKLPCVSFAMKDGGDFKNYRRGIAVRESGGVLHVTAALPESGLKKGDRIVALNRLEPADFYNRSSMRPAGTPLSGDEDWTAFLNHAAFASVVRADGGREEKVRFPELPSRGPASGPLSEADGTRPEAKRLPGGAAYVRLPDLWDGEKIETAVRDLRAARADASLLLLDLRGCRGGEPEELRPLLPYLCDEPMSRDAFFGEVRERTRYTERNCELFREQMKLYLRGSDEELRQLARERLEEIESFRGRDCAETEAVLLEPGGWIPAPDDGFEEVRILVDESTEGEAEWLASRAKRRKKARVFGRKSSGRMDYGSLVVMRWSYGAALCYPASRLVFGPDGGAGSARAIPDVEIPWTPEELRRDVILEAAAKR